MDTKSFETRTLFIERKNAEVEGYWPMAIDIGYSGVKGFSPNSVFCFPAYANKVKGEILPLGSSSPLDIQYKDERGAWNVGFTAIAQVSSGDTNDSIATLFGRNRYFSPMFLVLARVALAVGMMNNQFGGPGDKIPTLQTGLPPAYIKGDSKLIKEVLVGRHIFDVKVGNKPWKHYDFELAANDIKVMSQPMGSLLSAALDNNCREIPAASKYWSSNLLVLDAGFGTVDTFGIRRRQIEYPQSFNNLGMKAVLEETARTILEKYDTEVEITAMQKCLHDGYVTVFDRSNMTTNKQAFDDILKASSQKVCSNVIERIKTSYNDLIDYDYLLVTGGTGAAWLEQIKSYFAGMKSLTIITGNQNDSLSHIFSNVRGYYLYQIGMLKKEIAEKKKEAESK